MGGFYSSFRFKPQHISSLHINEKEAFVVLLFLQTMANKLSGKAIKIYIDNKVIQCCLRRRWSHSDSIMKWIYAICTHCVQYKIKPIFQWIPTEINIFADTLSRGKSDKFQSWMKSFGLQSFKYIDSVYPNVPSIHIPIEFDIRDFVLSHSESP